MAAGRTIIQWPIDVLFRPDRLATSGSVIGTHSLRAQIIDGGRILIFLSINLILYSLPLTIAGYGVNEGNTAPNAFTTAVMPFVSDPTELWQFLVALANNSAFLIVAALLTFGAFHIGILLIRTSKGILHSLRIVTYSVSIYLAIIFSLVWYLSLSPRIRFADEFLISLQAEFFYYFIDLFGVSLELPGGRPETIQIASLTTIGLMILSIILVAAVYFLYVLYIGAQVSHNATRSEAFVAIVFVVISPTLYVTGIIVFSLLV